MRYENPFRQLSRGEWILWLASLACVSIAFLLPARQDVWNLIAALIGVTALVFVSRGDVAGQVLTVLFSCFYGAVAYHYAYWGEMITYLGMSAPIALASTISWLRHPFQGNGNEVEAAHLTPRTFVLVFGAAALATALIGWLLALLDTPNLFWSIVSVTTSFLAATFTWLRSPWYGAAYAANDVVLMILWTLASLDDPGNVPMIVCFAAFFVQDIRGFFYWQRMKMRQSQEKSRD